MRQSGRYPFVMGVALGVIAVGIALPLGLGTPADAPGVSAFERDAIAPPRAVTNDDHAASSPGTTIAGTSSATATPHAQSDDAANQTSPARVPAGALGPTDVGVTARSIKIGFALGDLGMAGRLGINVPGASADDQRRMYQAYVDELNQRNGILGRRITPVFGTFDVTNADSQLAVCTKFTEDDHVFAVIGLLYGPAVHCVTRQHATTLIGAAGTTELYQAANGLLFSPAQRGARLWANLPEELEGRRVLRGRKIGVLTWQGLEMDKTLHEGLLPVLKKLGYSVAVEHNLNSDQSTASSQVPVAVQDMRMKGVDAVILGANLVNDLAFVQAAQDQRWEPAYFTADSQLVGSSGARAWPSGAEVLAIDPTVRGDARAGIAESPQDERCRRIYEAALGKPLDRVADEEAVLVALQYCGNVDLFVAGASAAGPTLTRPRLGAAIKSFSSRALPLYGQGSFGAGKFDGGDSVKLLTIDTACKCWRPVVPLHSARY